MKPTKEFDLDALLAHYQDNDDDFATDDVVSVEEGEWEIDFKDYATRSDTYRHVPSGRYFEISQRRSGSYYTDYFYDAPEIYEVYPVVRTRIVYTSEKPELP